MAAGVVMLALKVRSHVHPLMKDADHVYQSSIGKTVEEDVRANG